MFTSFLESLSNFLASIFGGRSTPKGAPPVPKPPVDVADNHLDTTLQDGQEVPQDTTTVLIETEVDMTPLEEDPFDGTPISEPEPAANVENPTTPTEEEEPSSETADPVVIEGDSEDLDAEDKEEEPAEVVEPPKPQSHRQRYLWCLDNGHGKLQAGKRSPIFDDGVTQFLEYEFNRDVVERIMVQLEEKGVAYFDVVPDVEEVGSFLKGRVNRANNKYSKLRKIFVSVHANASNTGSSGWGSTTGIETWYHKNSRKGKKIAAIFQKHLVSEMNWKNRHLKSSAITDLFVLRETWMPAILTENGFFTNKKQAAELMKSEVRQKIADAHVAAIMEVEKNGL